MADLHESSSLDDEVTAQVFASRRQLREARAAKPPARALRRSPVDGLRASTTVKRKRKNPLSVLATMGVVVGMVAVAGLPAYALTKPELLAGSKAAVVAQSLSVSADTSSVAFSRDGYTATTPEQLAQLNADQVRAANDAAYLASGAQALGDDYPWPYELTDDDGGGLSPLNYYYRECVDFVAWRLNRDQGFYGAPFKWVWSNLTPYGGDGGQWEYNWIALGRTVSDVPLVGAVAYMGGNHVAYVKAINADGTILIEEYNYIPGMYGQRTVAASAVAAFLYPPT